MTGVPAPRGLLVVGAGLIGCSAALAARRLGWQVWLQDRDPQALAQAVARGAGRSGSPASEPDLVLVAVPPRYTGAVVYDVLRTHPDSTVSDTSSIKANSVAEVKAQGADPGMLSRFIPGHPLAGSEVSGPAGARADLFADRVWVLTPGSAAQARRVEQVEAFTAALGAVVLRWEAGAHDRAVALTSHAPQLVSSLLAAQLAVDGAADTRLSGQGLRDMTRIAASDPVLWTQILTANAAPVADVLEPLSADLGALVAALRAVAEGGPQSAPAADAIHQVLRRGNQGHERIPGKHGAAALPTAALVVAVADRPGELARLFALAGEVGVNLEDVRIDHALGRPTGLVELTVAVVRLPDLVAALRERGWDVRE